MSGSIFDLPTQPSELKSANMGIDKSYLQQIAADRNSTGDNFSNGTIRFPFQVGATERWLPHRSFFRLRLNITNQAGAQLALANDVSLNMNPASCLWSQGEVRLNNTTISRCADYWSQIDTLCKRMDKSRSWIENAGNSCEILEARQPARANVTASDGSVLQDVKSVISGADLGVVADDNTIAYATATGVLTFAEGGANQVPDVSVIYPAGSIIRFPANRAALLAGDYVVRAGLTALTLQLEQNLTAADVVAGAVPLADFPQQVKNSRPDRNVSSLELNYQPLALSVFKCEKALPLGQWAVEMTPSQESVWKKRIIESLVGDKSEGAGNDYKVSVEQIYFYCAKVQTSRVDNLSYLIDLENTRAMQDQVQGSSLSQNTFNVSPSTYAITVGYQDGRAGVLTNVSQTKLKSYARTIPIAASDVPVDDLSTSLSRWYMQYGGQKYPQVDLDPAFTTTTDFFNQLYINSQLNTGGYMDSGGCETQKEWLERGLYLHYLTPKDGTSTDTRLTVNQQFDAASAGAADQDYSQNMRCLVFDHSRAAIKVNIKDGRVVDIEEYAV
jgi:hypothetical protein